MYVSDKYQIQWWLPPRTASRMTASFLRKLGFHQEWGHHTVFGESRNDVYLNIRNPYSLSISYYFLSHNLHNLNFDKFIQECKGNYGWMKNLHLMDYLEAFRDRKLTPKKVIRYENLEQDLLSLEIIQENIGLFENEIEKLKQGVSPWRTTYQPELLKPYCEYFNEELADIVYENQKKFFDFGSYEKDSWKTLKN